MARPLVFDIETLPLAASLSAPYVADDHSPPASYKLPEAIASWHAKNAEKWSTNRAKECSINPRLGRVLCLGTQSGTTYAMTEAEEKGLLEDFWSQAHAHAGRIVTWNGMGFDARFIMIRSLVHRIAMPVPETVLRGWFRRYSFDPHFDVKAALCNWDLLSKEGLDEWAAFFGLPEKPGGIDGSDVHFLFEQGRHDEIQAYCQHDAKTTEALYDIASRGFGVVG